MDPRDRKKVLVVEDSQVARALLEEIINGDPRLEVAATAASAEEALRLLPEIKPDVISLDIRLPGMNGMEAAKHIMARQPTPIVVVSACVEAGDLKISMNALKAGALVVVEKPAGGTRADYAALARRLRRQLLIMSEVPVIRRRGASDRPSGLARDRSPRPGGSYDAVGIVASTGGPNAVTRVLQALDASFPVPIFLVQHITASFVEGFVLWLDENAPLTVLIAKDHEKPLPAHVYVAPAGGHLEFDGTRLRVTGGAPQCGQRPSGTVLLRSMARSLGSRAIGMVLTGMGDDGADGLRAISDAGGYTIAEDRSTSVVYGMPKAAVERGAVQKQLPLQDIGRSLTALLTAPEDIAS